jgi:hypothetical protein
MKTAICVVCWCLLVQYGSCQLIVFTLDVEKKNLHDAILFFLQPHSLCVFIKSCKYLRIKRSFFICLRKKEKFLQIGWQMKWVEGVRKKAERSILNACNSKLENKWAYSESSVISLFVSRSCSQQIGCQV